MDHYPGAPSMVEATFLAPTWRDMSAQRGADHSRVEVVCDSPSRALNVRPVAIADGRTNRREHFNRQLRMPSQPLLRAEPRAYTAPGLGRTRAVGSLGLREA